MRPAQFLLNLRKNWKHDASFYVLLDTYVHPNEKGGHFCTAETVILDSELIAIGDCVSLFLEKLIESRFF